MNTTIIRVERDLNKPSMWRCKTGDNKTVNLFDNQLGYVNAYPEIAVMQPGDVLHWRSFPIRVQIEDRNGFFNLKGVDARPADAVPDQPLVVDHRLVYVRALGWARMVMHERVEVCTWDVETTGLDPNMDEVISIGIVNCAGEVLLDTLIRPRNLATFTATNASEINGITADQLADAPAFEDVYGQITAILHQRFWLGYNIGFDIRMLDATCLRYGLAPLLPVCVYDATPYVAEFIGQWEFSKGGFKYHKLADAIEVLKLGGFEAHTAAADALATWKLVKHMSMVR